MLILHQSTTEIKSKKNSFYSYFFCFCVDYTPVFFECNNILSKQSTNNLLGACLTVTRQTMQSLILRKKNTLELLKAGNKRLHDMSTQKYLSRSNYPQFRHVFAMLVTWSLLCMIQLTKQLCYSNRYTWLRNIEYKVEYREQVKIVSEYKLCVTFFVFLF